MLVTADDESFSEVDLGTRSFEQEVRSILRAPEPQRMSCVCGTVLYEGSGKRNAAVSKLLGVDVRGTAVVVPHGHKGKVRYEQCHWAIARVAYRCSSTRTHHA